MSELFDLIDGGDPVATVSVVAFIMAALALLMVMTHYHDGAKK